MSDFNSQLERMKTVVSSGQGSGRGNRDTCKKCGRKILAGTALVTSCGDAFHREHFQCAKCNKALSTDKHFYSLGEYYCPDCWAAQSPVCAGCGQPILEGAKITAMDKVWHEDHFRCAECNCLLQSSYAVRDGRPYCPDHARATNMMCTRCKKPISQGVYFNSKDGQRHWHEACFVCASCKMPFTDRLHYEVDGEVYCQLHYHTIKGSVCAACGLPVIGDALEANGAVWHVNCLKCAGCGRMLKGIKFHLVNDKPHCEDCTMRLRR